MVKTDNNHAVSVASIPTKFRFPFSWKHSFFSARGATVPVAPRPSRFVNDLNAKNGAGRILVLEPDDALNRTILSALREAAPHSTIELARTMADAQQLLLHERPDLFVLDVDTAQDFNEDFLLDLRTSHPQARAIVLTGAHLESERAQAAGIGAIHFLEKPFPHADFVDLVQTLLRAGSETGQEKFQGTLSDLHLSDIIQLKCMSGATSALEFTGPNNEKARVYFDHGQVRHAISPGREGVEAFNEIVSWKGGKISEVRDAGEPPQTLSDDWQFLLMEAVRKDDENSARRERRRRAQPSQRHKILVIDDSMMLLSFVQEILAEGNYDVVTGATAEEGLRAAREQKPDLILLDYILPDLRGDEVGRILGENEETADIPILFMSGFGADLETAKAKAKNVFGILNKPFTSDLLLKSVEDQLPKNETQDLEEPEAAQEKEISDAPLFADVSESVSPLVEEGSLAASEQQASSASRQATGELYFSGNTSFLSLNRALRIISQEKLTGVLRCFLESEPIELYTRDGKILFATTRDVETYCSDAPIALVNLDAARVAEARAEQTRSGVPLFLTLAQVGLISREPALQLVEHYGQKLFAKLWGQARVRFAYEQLRDLPDFARDFAHSDEVDHWALAALRFLTASELGERLNCEPHSIPAYTRHGFERVQNLKLTVAEAQFASQFNGSRSLAQIARNLRLDLKNARLTLARFLGLEIIECWPPTEEEDTSRAGFFKRRRN